MTVDCIMLNSVYDIFLVENIYLAIEESEAHAMGVRRTVWLRSHKTAPTRAFPDSEPSGTP